MYWIVTSPKDQLLTGHETGIIGFDAVESEQQNIAQGDFVIVYSSLETTGGARLDAFTGLGRTTDMPGQMPEGPWAINRRIAFIRRSIFRSRASKSNLHIQKNYRSGVKKLFSTSM